MTSTTSAEVVSTRMAFYIFFYFCRIFLSVFVDSVHLNYSGRFVYGSENVTLTRCLRKQIRTLSSTSLLSLFTARCCAQRRLCCVETV